jgi:Zn finger protein HypA/HybF involved in hydrogenase expression
MILEDYEIVRRTIDTIHNLQHKENSHHIDTAIERSIGSFTPLKMSALEKRFDDWRKGTAE